MITRRIDPVTGLLALGMLVSLGLPWRNHGLTSGFTSAWVPGYCTVTWDGYSYCSGAGVTTAISNSVTGPVPGFQLPARVLVVAAVLALVVALLRRSAVAVSVMLAAAVVAVCLGGLVPTSGRILFAGLVVAAALRLRGPGLRRRTPPDRRPRAARPA